MDDKWTTASRVRAQAQGKYDQQIKGDSRLAPVQFGSFRLLDAEIASGGP